MEKLFEFILHTAEILPVIGDAFLAISGYVIDGFYKVVSFFSSLFG